MFFHAKSGVVKIGNTNMDYVCFGKGKKPLIMLPGLSDGLSTVKGMAIPLAIMYRAYAKHYKVYVFSRKQLLKKDCSTRDMAKDQAEAMEELGLFKADIIGISQGGMIAQYIAIDYPNMVNKLVLAVTLSKQNKIISEVVEGWIKVAKQSNYKGLLIDTAEKSYSEQYLKRYRLLYPFLGIMRKPKDFSRFLIQANSCIQHNAYHELDKIICPTLVVGGSDDKIVGLNSAVEITEKIENSQLVIYKGLGHAVYEEAKDFKDQVLSFLTSDR